MSIKRTIKDIKHRVLGYFSNNKANSTNEVVINGFDWFCGKGKSGYVLGNKLLVKDISARININKFTNSFINGKMYLDPDTGIHSSNPVNYITIEANEEAGGLAFKLKTSSLGVSSNSYYTTKESIDGLLNSVFFKIEGRTGIKAYDNKTVSKSNSGTTAADYIKYFGLLSLIEFVVKQ